MAKQNLPLLLLAVTLVEFVATCSAVTMPAMNTTLRATTAYDVLVKNNLPRGLLPNGVQSYTLTPEGKLDVTLPGFCDFPVTVGGAVYKMRFGNKVGGVIKPGSIEQAHGVRVQVSYAWLGISGVDRVADQIMISVQEGKPLPFPVRSFAVSPSCS